ncbi:hypothetical protein M3B14_09505 [Kocuria marina]|uniref:hypothetical protein n=1 Tax=Kocuria marina TaxID=223184 RepID=UPI002989F253|nr:hypothetical protein [Kocuria marina]MCT1723833.1 hypothetical protein [Kocuria marina]MCT1733759.1 hypothetical protein [Kocuria marina]
MSQVTEFFRVAPPQRNHVPATRIALSVAVPLLFLLVVGRTDLAIYAAFGAFTSIYARNEPIRARFTHQTQAGVLITACGMLGVLLSNLGASEPVTPVPEHHGLTTGQLCAHAGRFFLATGVAGILGSLSGLSHSYWAMVAADTQAIPLMRQAANGST